MHIDQQCNLTSKKPTDVPVFVGLELKINTIKQIKSINLQTLTNV